MGVLRRPGFAAFALASAGVAWAGVIVLLAAVAPVYNDGETLVGVNGLWVLAPTAALTRTVNEAPSAARKNRMTASCNFFLAVLIMGKYVLLENTQEKL